jgi:N-acetylmuramic acid 6-phosphate etherase
MKKMNRNKQNPRSQRGGTRVVALPADRSKIATEQRNARAKRLHEMSVGECTALINREDAQVQRAVRGALPELTKFIEDVSRGFCDAKRPGRLIYVGAGTSGRLGVLDASETPPTFCVGSDRIIGIIAGGDSALRVSSEGREDELDGARAELAKLKLTPRDAVLAIAAGGTTPYAIGALSIAKRIARGCVTGFLTCTPVKRPIGCDHVIVLRTGPEVLTGSTRMKAGSATKMALNIISTTLMVQSGRVYENLMVDVRATNEKLRDRAARVVSQATGVERARAFEVLGEAGWSAKVAIVMVWRGCSRAEAERLLKRSGGRLGKVESEK